MSAPNRLVWLLDDDDALLRSLRRVLLTLDPHLDVACFKTAERADAALRSRARPPDACVVDHILPGATGADWLTRNAAELEHTRAVLLTGHPSPELSRRAGLLRVPLLIKPQGADVFDTLLLAPRCPAAPPSDAAIAAAWPPWKRLTPTHQKIVRLAVDGLRNDEIARNLRIEYCTMKTNVHEIKLRTDCEDMREVVETVLKALRRR